MSSEVIFIDVRDPEAYAQGHIPGAFNLPELLYTLSMTTQQGLQEMEDVLRALLCKADVDRDKIGLSHPAPPHQQIP
jgi:thiosulfate/3-mercaptopyruvate sulfurtransferase